MYDTPDRRQPSQASVPAYEDAGLFTTEVTQVTVDLVPSMSRNGRDDLLVRGFIGPHTAITVCFAGRRGAQALAVERRLRMMWSRAVKLADQAKQLMPDSDTVRLPVRIEGAWRPIFQRDASGWERRTHHLIAARWSLVGPDGASVAYGEPPAVQGQVARR